MSVQPVRPARHRLSRGVTAAFFGRADAAARLLEERGIPGRPALFWPGRTLVVVAYQEFEASPVGPYRQVSVSLPLHLPSVRSAGRGGGTGRAARAPVLLPLVLQAVWNTERFYRDLHFYVAAIPVSAEAAVAYSRDIWGEPAWPAVIETAPGPRRGRLEVRVAAPGAPSPPSLVLSAAVGGLGLTERRGYRLVSRSGPGLLRDVMRVEAPCRLGFGPGRARLELGADDRLGPLREVVGPRAVCLETLAHASGVVTFGGPEAWPEAGPAGSGPAGREGEPL